MPSGSFEKRIHARVGSLEQSIQRGCRARRKLRAAVVASVNVYGKFLVIFLKIGNGGAIGASPIPGDKSDGRGEVQFFNRR
jgi:hypothetical protein